MVPAAGLEVQPAGGLLVEVQIRARQAQEISVRAAILVLVHEAAQATETVGLEPAFQREIAGHVEIVGVRNLHIVADAVEGQGVTRHGHGNNHTPLFTIFGAAAVGGIRPHIVGLADHEVGQGAGKGTQAATVQRVAIGNRRAAAGVPTHAARNHRVRALVGHRASTDGVRRRDASNRGGRHTGKGAQLGQGIENIARERLA